MVDDSGQATTRTRFNLITEPWIRCRLSDGSLVELSLAEAFARSSEIVGLAGELPSQDVAVLRVLLAVLHRSIPVDDEPTLVWQALWQAPDLPLDSIREHLGEHHFRFDLLDASAPFMQVADLHTSKNEFKELQVLVTDVPNGDPFFTTRAGAGLNSMSFAEGARWLIHCHGFDISGIKSGAVGDPRVKGGKGYPIGTGWVGQLGCIVVEGQNLRETLLLNLVLQEPDRTPDLPIWERPPHASAVEPKHEVPAGVVDLLTWQSRRIRLGHDGHRVTQVLVCNGDPLHGRNRQRQEPMTAWRYSEPQSKKESTTVYMPRTHRPDRALWRGLESLLAQDGRASGRGKDVARSLEPGVLTWIARLKNEGMLDESQLLRTRAVGLEYGSQSSVVVAATDDTLMLPVAVLSDAVVKRTATQAVSDADQAVRALADLAKNLAQAAGGEADSVRESAFENGYHVLDAPFKDWLITLPVAESAVMWQRTVFSRLRSLGEEMIATAGQPAVVGRVVKSNRGEMRMDAGRAAVFFAASLRKALPLAKFEDRKPSGVNKEDVDE